LAYSCDSRTETEEAEQITETTDEIITKYHAKIIMG
jgi:hypothetical protein